MSKKIVIIDDEKDVLQIVQATLITKNYDVYPANSGQEGLQLAAQEKPDLIICDLMMPRMSGLEVIKRLHRNPETAGIPIMVLSALGNDDRPAEFWIRSLHVSDYVQKPFDPLDLLGRVEYLLRRGDYVSNRQTPSSQDDSTGWTDDANATQSPINVEDIPPQHVVRAFIESYNQQDFATEFHCLADEMTGGQELRDYVARRRQMYVQEKSQGRRQRLISVDEEKVSLNIAKVTSQREDTLNGQSKLKRESYMLKKTHKGWKIVNVREVKEKSQA